MISNAVAGDNDECDSETEKVRRNCIRICRCSQHTLQEKYDRGGGKHGDHVFDRFMDRIRREPRQIMRYNQSNIGSY